MARQKDKNGKKFLTKNEFRRDLNPEHIGSNNMPHPAYITGKRGHKYHASTITHARYVGDEETLLIEENPDKLSKDSRASRLSKPFWQNDKKFSKDKLDYFRFSKKSRSKIKKFHKKHK